MRYMHDAITPLRIKRATGNVANFDSATAMLRAAGKFLRGKDFSAIGLLPPLAMPLMEQLVGVVNSLPRQVREFQYSVQGAGEAITPQKLAKVKAEDLSHWVVSQYPAGRKYPAVAIGSSSGALVHLCAALQIPWLPQTHFIPVKLKEVHVDEPKDAFEWGRCHAGPLLDNNPELQLHHMHDPNQDRLMLQRMTYFRVKRRVLGETYKKYLRNSLDPGGTILVSQCSRTWPVTRINERHVFQFGATGGASEKDFFEGKPAVKEYLEKYGSHRQYWDPPKPTEQSPEAEWGFEQTLLEDIEKFAAEEGYEIKKLQFDEPEDLSPFVADLYRDWYRQRNHKPNRLLIESFLILEPQWVLRTGSVPYWMKFNMIPSAEAAERYLANSDPYDYINLTLFSHGVEAVGLATIDRWQKILDMAQKEGNFIGVDPDEFPLDFGVLARYYTDMKRKIPSRYPMPGPLLFQSFLKFYQAHKDQYEITIS
jgi:hypothetical protein